MDNNQDQNQKDWQEYQDYQEYQKSKGAGEQYGPGVPFDDSAGNKLKSMLSGGQQAAPTSQDLRHPPSERVEGMAPMAIPAGQAPAAMASLGEYLGGSGVGPAVSRIAANASLGGAQGAIHNPGDRLGGAERGAALSGALSTAGEGIAGMAGNAANKLMQWSAGMRKNNPAVGESLLDQGIWGTKGGMAGQVSSKLQEEEANLQELVGQLKGNVDSKELADAVAKHGEKFVSPSGITLDSVAPDLEKVTQAAGQFDPSRIGAEGPTRGLTPQDLLSFKRQGDWGGYTASGNPASATDSEIGRAIADKSRSLLSDMSDGATKETLGREQALIIAKKALEKPDTIHQGLGSGLFFGKIPGSALAGSAGAHLLKDASYTAGTAADPIVLQSLFNEASKKR